MLPAILLAGVGFYSLRQDRVLAEHDATEQAKKIAADLARTVLPNVLKTEPLPPVMISASGALPQYPAALSRAQPQDDPVLALATRRAARVACEVSASGELIYPPLFSVLPRPTPLDAGELNAEQRAAWDTAGQAVFVEQNPAAAIAAIGRFSILHPPDDFMALALYRLAVLCETQGDIKSAEQNLASVIERYPNAVGETGVPLKIFAALRLAQFENNSTPSGASRAGWLNAVCAWAVLNPSPLSQLLMEKVGAVESRAASGRDGMLPSNQSTDRGTRSLPQTTANVGVRPPVAADRPTDANSSPITAAWQKVWDAHERARALWENFLETMVAQNRSDLADADITWLKTPDGQSWLVTTRFEGTNGWLFAQAEDSLRRGLRETLAAQSLPAYFGVAVDVAGRNLASARSGTTVLASSTGREIKVSVHLADPVAFYARQRVRTMWFGSLIGVSVAAVLLGFVTAWRAFQRQRRLSEMKTNFVSSVSHELRAPIASVRLMAEELEDIGPHDRQKSKEYHRFIVQECRRLSGLIENVLDFARHEQGRKQYEFEPTDLVALVRETARLMQTYAADRQIQVTTTVAGEPVAAEVDGQAIQRVLVNLIDNAIKHSPAQSSVTVGLEFPPTQDHDERKVESKVQSPESGTDGRQAGGNLTSEIANPKSELDQSLLTPAATSDLHSLNSQPSTLNLFVEDHGAGIPPEDHERIFERFYRRGSELRRETQGVGLGLAIVKYVTEAHGGKVTVRSAVGQGSRFTVQLPLLKSQTGGPSAG
ncbi:MAG: ATP-binding protein [Limisphaerales bacterium]